MSQRFSFETVRSKSFILSLIYIVVFALGLLFGLSLVSRTGESSAQIVCGLAESDFSAVYKLLLLFLPLLLTVTLIRLKVGFILFSLLFFKTALLSFSAYYIVSALRYSGWLFCLLLLFAELCSFIIYHWVWLRLISRGVVSRRCIIVCVLLLLGIFAIDFFFISPFTAMLFID